MRTDFTSLPTVAELKKIISQESQRLVQGSKKDIHYPDFRTIIQLLEHFQLPTTYFTSALTLESLEKNNYIDQVNSIGKALLTLLPVHTENIELYNAMYDYLAEEETRLIPSDILFVFGAKTSARIEKAIELYHKKLGKKIWISGGHPFYQDTGEAEADTFRKLAIHAGIPANDILTESASITIPDNIRSSLNLMDKMQLKPQSITIINSPYSQRRSFCVFKKHTPDTLLLQRANCKTGADYNRNNWFKNPNGIKVVFNEFVKLKLTVIFNDA